MTKPTKNKRYVVDISDLIHWHGNLSGIQRVVAEMAYRYNKVNAFFCYYNEKDQAFFALDISFDEFIKDRQKQAHARAYANMEAVQSQSAGRASMKRVASQLSPPIIIRTAQKIKNTLENQFSGNSESDPRERFNFQKNDTLIVAGAHWDKPHYTEVLRAIKKERHIRIAHMIHDLIPIMDRGHVADVEHVRFPKYIREISQLSDIIYLTSVAAQNDYAKFLKDESITSPQIQIVPLGDNFTSIVAPTRPEQIEENEQYILTVGTIEVRKNHALLYATYKRALEKGIELPKLVVVGRRGWLSGDVYYQMVHDYAVSDRIIFMHDVNDQELAWLYKNCLYTVFPSFYEGWGLPIAEAAHYGKVTASSNKSSMPEVVGSGAIYFSPFSSDECLDALVALKDPATRKKYEGVLKKREPITWDRSFQATLPQ